MWWSGVDQIGADVINNCLLDQLLIQCGSVVDHMLIYQLLRTCWSKVDQMLPKGWPRVWASDPWGHGHDHLILEVTNICITTYTSHHQDLQSYCHYQNHTLPTVWCVVFIAHISRRLHRPYIASSSSPMYRVWHRKHISIHLTLISGVSPTKSVSCRGIETCKNLSNA